MRLAGAVWLISLVVGASAGAQVASPVCHAPVGSVGCLDVRPFPGEDRLAAGHSAWFSEPTRRYAHGVLGDDVEWGALNYATGPGLHVRVSLGSDRVFEDLVPRLADLDGDGAAEIVVVESAQGIGAQLAIYALRGGELEKVASTPAIGQANRWLAPAGIADFDGDGHGDIAYVETPHLGKTLRFWRYRPGRLEEFAALRGVTNHRIGEDFISSMVRDCPAGPEVRLADAAWARAIGVRIDEAGKPVWRDLGPWRGREALVTADCG